jgi:putative (di)nucleoside polyphosphate hydrolase
MTLWRELHEEVGLTKDDIAVVDEYPHWTVYQYDHTVDDVNPSRLGQAHRWYFLKLKANVTIDLNKATEAEAAAVRFLTFDEVLAETGDFKRHVYQELQQYFTTNIHTN